MSDADTCLENGEYTELRWMTCLNTLAYQKKTLYKVYVNKDAVVTDFVKHLIEESRLELRRRMLDGNTQITRLSIFNWVIVDFRVDVFHWRCACFFSHKVAKIVDRQVQLYGTIHHANCRSDASQYARFVKMSSYFPLMYPGTNLLSFDICITK